MNVGGHRITNAELASHFEAIGLDEVACFRASGNVVFSTAPEPQQQLTDRIEENLEKWLGYAAPTFLRDAEQMRALAAHQPFTGAEVQASAGKLQVMLLLVKPTAAVRKQVAAHATTRDRLAFGERELYWLPSGGILDSALDLKAIGKLLGATTLRTKGTVEQMAKKYFAD